MKAEKDQKTGKWMIQYHYTDWQGERRKSTKRGFKTKKGAEDWLLDFLFIKAGELDMKFSQFISIYYEDMKARLRESTMRTKRCKFDIAVSKRRYGDSIPLSRMSSLRTKIFHFPDNLHLVTWINIYPLNQSINQSGGQPARAGDALGQPVSCGFCFTVHFHLCGLCAESVMKPLDTVQFAVNQ